MQAWQRTQRIGAAMPLRVEHLMASSALPFIFPAVKINREYFGDGSMRQVAPISPALHLGAGRVFVIGTGRQVDAPPRVRSNIYPSLAQVAGHALNSIFLDSLYSDIERLERINRTISLIPPDAAAGSSLRPVKVLVISPSQPLERIAMRFIGELPWTVRFLLRGIGAMNRNGSNLASYLLFEEGFCRALIDLGYRDTLERRFPLLWVSGEISNLRPAASGHWYFVLKDAHAQVRCVMFRNRNQALDWQPREGMQVAVRALPGRQRRAGLFYQGICDRLELDQNRCRRDHQIQGRWHADGLPHRR